MENAYDIITIKTEERDEIIGWRREQAGARKNLQVEYGVVFWNFPQVCGCGWEGVQGSAVEMMERR